MYASDHGIERVVFDVFGPQFAIYLDEDARSNVPELDPYQRAEIIHLLVCCRKRLIKSAERYSM